MPVAGWYYNCNKSNGGWLGLAVRGLADLSLEAPALLKVANGIYECRVLGISHEGEFIIVESVLPRLINIPRKPSFPPYCLVDPDMCIHTASLCRSRTCSAVDSKQQLKTKR